MKKALAVVFASLTFIFAGPAYGQATRTWVSGVGDDVNPCSRTAPCKTFAGAISKTATGGEINCLDPGGFGGVTITKALSIVCNYTEGGVLSAGAGVNGIVINAPATSNVYLRGLDLHGAGNAQNGIRFIAGASLTIEDSVIQSYGASNARGVSFQPSGTSRLTINNTTIVNNGSGATGGGILIQPTGVGSARVVLNNVRAVNNSSQNLGIDTTGNTGAGITVMIEGGDYSGSGTGILANAPAGTTTAAVMVNGATVAHNTTAGITSNGTLAVIRVGNTSITNNGIGVNPTGGASLASFGDNRLEGNPTAGAPNNGNFTGVVIPKR